MAEHRLGIIMHGVTGRMGTNQHLARSIAAIRQAGGVELRSGARVMPDPVLVGRNADKLRYLEPAQTLLAIAIRLLLAWFLIFGVTLAVVPPTGPSNVNFLESDTIEVPTKTHRHHRK